jgi:hypothetical protein
MSLAYEGSRLLGRSLQKLQNCGIQDTCPLREPSPGVEQQQSRQCLKLFRNRFRQTHLKGTGAFAF